MSGDPRGRRAHGRIDAGIGVDPYATLGLPAGAPLGDVKRAYRRLAKAFHPDSAGAAALPRFLAIHAAYERITTGRALPGASSPPTPSPGASSAASPREPWRADPARARATRQRAASGGAARRAGSQPGGGTANDDAANDPAGGGRRGRSSGDRRTSTRKATLGSTSYDEARDRVDATWGGASWYGPSTGEYWIINPREYADPRKHGPAYQARVREAAAEAELASDGMASAETASAGAATADVVFDETEAAPAADPPSPQPPRGRPRHDPPGRARRSSGGPSVSPPAAVPLTGERRPPHRIEAAAVAPEAEDRGLL